MTDIQQQILERAELIARKAHWNMLRKFSNKDYITHPEAVAASVIGWDYKAVAWLHDVEDNPAWDFDRLIAFGIPTGIVDSVRVLTKQRGEDYYDFIIRILESHDPRAVAVKIADITHNLSDLNPLSNKGLRDKYRLARHILENERI